MQTDIIRYSLQVLTLTVGSVTVLFFGLMCPVLADMHPYLAILTFVIGGAFAFLTVEVVDRIDTWADRHIFIETNSEFVQYFK